MQLPLASHLAHANQSPELLSLMRNKVTGKPQLRHSWSAHHTSLQQTHAVLAVCIRPTSHSDASADGLCPMQAQSHKGPKSLARKGSGGIPIHPLGRRNSGQLDRRRSSQLSRQLSGSMRG